jgi:hypothetical protein
LNSDCQDSIYLLYLHSQFWVDSFPKEQVHAPLRDWAGLLSRTYWTAGFPWSFELTEWVCHWFEFAHCRLHLYFELQFAMQEQGVGLSDHFFIASLYSWTLHLYCPSCSLFLFSFSLFASSTALTSRIIHLAAIAFSCCSLIIQYFIHFFYLNYLTIFTNLNYRTKCCDNYHLITIITV